MKVTDILGNEVDVFKVTVEVGLTSMEHYSVCGYERFSAISYILTEFTDIVEAKEKAIDLVSDLNREEREVFK